MLLVKIPDLKAYEDLKDLYNLTGYNSFLQTMRYVTSRLLEEATDSEVQLEFPLEFLHKSYQRNPTIFARMLQRKLQCIVKATKKPRLEVINGKWMTVSYALIHCGFIHRPRSFIGKIIAILQNPKNRAVDIALKDMPKSYREQPYHFITRINKSLGETRLKLINLGDEYRIAKLTNKPRKTKVVNYDEIRKLIIHKYVRTEFA